ncbi:MAG: hypothetical protein DMF80_04420 [Acidobacteria bacterium]|nr:MAG: hypothetical protein DMF80_04420 [Acidobacteriota bacterium]PYQ22135.1 MAG: hypothetical protein DMF81_13285 [Acidobacteriota bacterium]
MPVLLMVDRSEPGPRNESRISAMLWSSDHDPWLLEAQQFRGEHELRRWLGQVAAKYGRDVAVRWTDKLKAEKMLATAVAECLGIAVP